MRPFFGVQSFRTELIPIPDPSNEYAKRVNYGRRFVEMGNANEKVTTAVIVSNPYLPPHKDWWVRGPVPDQVHDE